jgi:non-lysosomal glucosylceramidase
LAWDFPILETQAGTKWYKRYTKFFGKDGRSITNIARKAFSHSEKWLLDIKKWQEDFLKLDKPDWFKVMLINELYFLAQGGTFEAVGGGLTR